MKYCSHCGAEIMDEAVVCVKCGCAVESAKANTAKKDNETMKTIIKVFLILGTIASGLAGFLIPLAWCIPMTVSICRKMKNDEEIGTGLKVCTLLFVNIVSGILLLCMNNDQ